MRLTARLLIGSCLLGIAGVSTATEPFSGRFLGSGRACYGTLAVRAKTISWLTPLSQCKAVPYELIERNEQAGALRVTYRLKHSTASCRYTILSLTHAGPEDDTGWDVTGYGSEQSFRADRSSGYKSKGDDMMSCYLTRDPGK